MRILVTGGNGFLGRHLCSNLLAAGHEIVCLDNLMTSAVRTPLVGVHFVEHDVVEPFPDSLGPVDRIYHLACPASPVHYQADSVYTAKIAFLGTLHALEYARKTGARLLQASTSEVYGDPHTTPQKETDWGNVNCTGVRACYDEGKRIGETLCFDYLRECGVDVRVVRIFNTYGPGMHPLDGRVISNFVTQAIQGHPLTIYGDGSQTRSFCYVQDLVRGFEVVMEQTSTVGPVNLGNPAEFSMLDIAQQILEACESTSKLEFQPLPSDDPRQRRPDISRAAELGWSPQTSVADGLAATVAYFRSLDLASFRSPTRCTAHQKSRIAVVPRSAWELHP